jgi:DNA-binding beta-propeller fold protein YncE
MSIKSTCALLLLLAAATPAGAQIAVSANDGKHAVADAPKEAPGADSIAVLDLAEPVKVLAELAAPASLVGPPAAVAVARDSSFAVVTAAEQLDADGKVAPADIVTVLDLHIPAKPAVAQTLHAGKGASGVAIDPSGSLALVANAGDDSISVFVISQRRLSGVGTVALAPKSKPLDIGFADLHTAYVVEQGADAIVRLDVDGRKVSVAQSIAVGSKPYSMAIARQVAYVTNLGGRVAASPAGSATGTVAIVDLHAGKIVDQIDVGVTPEHVALSPSGRYLEVTVINGSNAPAASSSHHDHGIMAIYRAQGLGLIPVTHAETGAWCQGATWSDDDRRVLLQCAARKQIEVYGFDGKTLTPGAGAAIELSARPGAIATARSR